MYHVSKFLETLAMCLVFGLGNGKLQEIKIEEASVNNHVCQASLHNYKFMLSLKKKS